MALKKCVECKKEISDQATLCPSCGCPMKATTIEKTSKIWKVAQLTSILIALMGFITIGISCNSDFRPAGIHMADVGFTILFMGIILIVVTKVGAWWYHG